jgi:hypothetical protein
MRKDTSIEESLSVVCGRPCQRSCLQRKSSKVVLCAVLLCPSAACGTSIYAFAEELCDIRCVMHAGFVKNDTVWANKTPKIRTDVCTNSDSLCFRGRGLGPSWYENRSGVDGRQRQRLLPSFVLSFVCFSTVSMNVTWPGAD